MKNRLILLVIGLLLVSACQPQGSLGASPQPTGPANSSLPGITAGPPPSPTAQKTIIPAGQAATDAIPLTGGDPVRDAKEISGIWVVDHPDFHPGYMILSENGKIRFAPSPDGSHGQTAGYKVQNGRFEYNDSVFCGTTIAFDLRIIQTAGQPDRLLFVPTGTPSNPADPPCVKVVSRILTKKMPERYTP